MTRIVCNNLAAPVPASRRHIADCYFYNGTQKVLTTLAGRAVRLNAKLYWAVNPTKLGLPKAALSTIRYELAEALAQAQIAYLAGILTQEATIRYTVMHQSVSLELEAIVKSRRTRYSQYLTPPSHHAELTALCDAMICELDALIDAAYEPGQTRSARLSGPAPERSEAGEESASDRDPVTGAEYGTPT